MKRKLLYILLMAVCLPSFGIDFNKPYPMSGHKVEEHKGTIRLLPGFSAKARDKNESVRFCIWQMPQKISLKYYDKDASHNEGKPFLYEAVRIGEYYWMNRNFSHAVKPGFSYGTDGSSGSEQLIPLNQAYIDKYLSFVHLKPGSYNVGNFDEFKKYYGEYYSMASVAYLSNGKILENDVQNSAWGLPKRADFYQLAAMCDATTRKDYLIENDIRRDLSVKKNDNQFAYNFTGAHFPQFLDHVYWFADSNTNKYGFNMMPSGARFHGDRGNHPKYCMKFHKDEVEECLDYKKGDIYQLFYALRYPVVNEGSGPEYPHYKYLYAWTLNIHDQIDTEEKLSYHLRTVRWCRRLTNEELGYKLYINRTDYKETSDFMRSINPDAIRIERSGPNTTAEKGWMELPNGFLRGFYVQYILNKTDNTPSKTISDIVKLAANTVVYNFKGGQIPFLGLSSDVTRSTTSIEESVAEESPSSIRIYPNPVKDALNIEADEPIVSVAVFGATGQKVFENGAVNNQIDMSNLPSGVYIVKVKTESNSYTQKVFKK